MPDSGFALLLLIEREEAVTKASSLPAIIVARRGLIVKLRRAFFSSTPRRQPPRAQTPVPELKPARRNVAPACNSRSLKAENRFFASARNNADSKGRRTTTVTRALTKTRPIAPTRTNVQTRAARRQRRGVGLTRAKRCESCTAAVTRGHGKTRPALIYGRTGRAV